MFNLGLVSVCCVNRDLAYLCFVNDANPWVFRRRGALAFWRFRGAFWVPR
jgi:hypothetical protein